MYLTQTPFEQIGHAELVRLIDNNAQEGLRLEFKRDQYDRSDKQKKELLKDVSSFANTSGGHLLIGIDEKDGVADTLVGIANGPDEELQWLENLIRDGLEPRIIGIKIKAVPLDAGHVIIIHIPNSFNSPHRVTLKGSNKFYGRTSAGAYELDVNQLRQIFNGGTHLIERARQFRLNRLKTLSNEPIIASSTSDEFGYFVLHLIPYSALFEENAVDIGLVHDDYNLFSPPPPSYSLSRSYNFEGVRKYDSQATLPHYTQLFRNGIVETVVGGVGQRRGEIRSFWPDQIEKLALLTTNRYLKNFQEIDISAPIFVLLSLCGLQGAKPLGPRINANSSVLRPIDQNDIQLPEIMLDEILDDEGIHRKLKPTLDILWNTFGMPASLNYDVDGVWHRPPD
jgi:Schlafen, AlbA_2